MLRGESLLRRALVKIEAIIGDNDIKFNIRGNKLEDAIKLLLLNSSV